MKNDLPVALPGEKVSDMITVINAQMQFPVTVIRGEKEGKTLLITGGIHNAEYTGIEAAYQLAEELKPEEISGSVIIAPLINTNGFEHRTMSLTYEDGKNLNREFPGSPLGTLSERICYTVVQKLQQRADYYIDLHCGDGYEKLHPYVYHVGAASETVVEEAKKMAHYVNTEYRVRSFFATGGSYNYAGYCGIPSILIERGCMGSWFQQEVDADKEDVKNVMRALSVLEDGKEAVRYRQTEVGMMVYEDSPCAGRWYPKKMAGEKFHQDDVIGVIKDYLGKILYTCYAKMDGVVLYHTGSLNVLQDGPLTAYGAILEQPE